MLNYWYYDIILAEAFYQYFIIIMYSNIDGLYLYYMYF